MDRAPVLAVALVSAAALAYEILLMRLFSIGLWHHFAAMIISLALLGYGAGGALLTLAPRAIERRFVPLFCAFAAAFGIGAALCFLLSQHLPFNPLELLWDPWQPLWLMGTYLLLSLPFLCAGACVCLALARFRGMQARIYAFDILGAGVGSLGVVGLLFVLTPQAALKPIAALGWLAAACAWAGSGGARRWPMALLFAGAGATLLLPTAWLAPAMSPYKELVQTLRVPGARVVLERSSPLGLVSVVESPRVPLRHAPGLSLNATAEPPPQWGVFTDGEGMNALARFDGRRDSLAYLDQLASALPYHLLQRPRVLVLGAGAGADVLQAHYHGAARIDAVELNPQVVALVRERFGEASGGLYDGIAQPHVAEARAFLAKPREGGERYDLVQVALLEGFGASAAGLHALAENYLYTVESLQSQLRHLRPGGLLALTRWAALPPRDMLKLFATAIAALERSGVADPGAQLVLIRSWKTSTLLVKNGAFGAGELAAVRAFCQARSFDLGYLPGMRADEANRYNRVEGPDLFEGATALLGPGRDAFLRDYKFHIAPATDDRPHFFHFFKWRTLPELLALKERGGLPLIEWGYPVLAATLMQALFASLVLIGLPLAWLGRREGASPGPAGRRGRVLLYFLAIGFGFMFVEMAFIQKFVLFLGHPLYAVAVVLFAFLLFAGVGSRAAARRPPLRVVVAAITVLALLCLLLLPWLLHHAMGWPEAARIGLAVLLIAPLAFFMGMPFPLGLARVEALDARLLPWAWAINGCASVVAAVLASLLAIELGFTAVVLAALGLYGLAAAARP